MTSAYSAAELMDMRELMWVSPPSEKPKRNTRKERARRRVAMEQQPMSSVYERAMGRKNQTRGPRGKREQIQIGLS